MIKLTEMRTGQAKQQGRAGQCTKTLFCLHFSSAYFLSIKEKKVNTMNLQCQYGQEAD
ncbi:MAG: hypothetical protein HC819_00255 [Cyclobacteriaceae bacterium]|nr:hypothetical protein [Cyclobacteriaceae bacterium]